MCYIKLNAVLDKKLIDICNEKILEYLLKTKKVCALLEGNLEQKPFENVIKMAAISVDKNGKEHYHQHRLQKHILRNFAKALVRIEDKIKKAKDFEELLELVNGKKIYGIGELAIYDTALRIGEYLGIEPDRIYLHAGTKAGVERLFERMGSKKQLRNREYIYKKELPEPFCSCRLTPSQLEDLFCEAVKWL